jgi:hypothetical protein
MSANKRGGGADSIYSNHLLGQYANNNAVNRQSKIIRIHESTLSEMAMNRFEWKGLPDSINQRFIEQCLFFNGLSVVYFDRRYDAILAVRGSGQSYVNAFDEPVAFNVIAPGSPPLADPNLGGYAKPNSIKAYQPQSHADFTKEKLQDYCVPIWTNYLRFPEVEIVQLYAYRLGIIDRTLEINTKNARRNKVLVASEETKLTMVNINNEIDKGSEIIQVTAPYQDMEEIKTIDLGILPDSYEKLALLRTRIWNEVIMLFGIDGSNQDKKERLVAAEIGANDSQADSFRFVALNARQYAAEQINKVFGTDISVDFRVENEKKEAQENAMEQMNNKPTEGDDNEHVHDDSKKSD